jgi:hypothetical protein
MRVVLTGSPVKPVIAISPAPTSSAEAPCASVRCALSSVLACLLRPTSFSSLMRR